MNTSSKSVLIWRRFSGSAVLSSWLNLSSRLVGLAILVPLALAGLALEDFVIWQIFLTTFALGAVLDIGLGPTLSRFVSYSFGGAAKINIPDWRTIGSIFAFARIVYAILALLVFLLLVFVGQFVLSDVLEKSTDPEASFRAWYVISAAVSLHVFGMHQVALLQGIQLIPLQQFAQCVSVLVASIAAAVVLLLEGGLLSLAIAYSSMAPLTFALNWFNIKRVRPNEMEKCYSTLAFINERLPLIRDIGSSTWRSGVGVFAVLAFAQGCGILVAKLYPAEIAAAFLLSFQVLRAVNTFAAVPFLTRVPVMSAAFAQGDNVRLTAIAVAGMRRCYLVYTILAGGFLLIGNSLIAWAGPDMHLMTQSFLSILCLAYLLERFGAMHMYMMTVRNIVRWHEANGITVIVAIALLFATYDKLGIIAFPVCILTGNIVAYVLFIARLSYRTNHLSFPEFELRTHFVPYAIAMLAVGGATTLGH